MSESAPTRNEISTVGFAVGTAGVTPPSSSTGRQGVFLTDVLVELGFTDKARVDEAEEAARVSGKTVEQLLLDDGAIDEGQLSLAIAERNGLDHVDLERFEVDRRATEAVSRSVATSCGAVPIAFSSDGRLIVAVQDSFDSLAVRRMETAIGAEVRPVIAAVGAIERLIERMRDERPAEDSEEEVPRIKSQRELQVGGSEGPDGEGEEEEEETSEAPARADEPARPAAGEPRSEPGEGKPDSFDGLSMDLGPITMEPGDEEKATEAVKPKKLKKAAEREDRLARELAETKGRVAELERHLEELLDAAEEATETTEKLDALRRAIDESGF